MSLEICTYLPVRLLLLLMFLKAKDTVSEQNPINVSCADICSPKGCTFKVPDNLTEIMFKYEDRELGWYNQNGDLLADPSYPNRLLPPATKVTSTILTTQYCVDGISFDIKSYKAGVQYKIEYKAVNRTAAEHQGRGASSSSAVYTSASVAALLLGALAVAVM